MARGQIIFDHGGPLVTVSWSVSRATDSRREPFHVLLPCLRQGPHLQDASHLWDLLNDRDPPFYQALGGKVQAISANNRPEFCGPPDNHACELFLQLNEIEQRTTKVSHHLGPTVSRSG